MSLTLTPIQRAAFVAEYHRQRGLLLEAYPDIDLPTLEDTLEGMTYAPDMIAGLIRDAREDEAYVSALSVIIREMGDRKARFEHRAQRRRLAAQHLMDAIGIRKLDMPDFTASIRAVPSRVEIDDETALPDVLCKIVRVPDKAAIKAALEISPVSGARMTNGGETLSIRTK